MQLPGIYVEIKGDYSQLEKNLKAAKALVTQQATGISDALNNALSPTQVKNNIDRLVANFGTLNRASSVSSQAFSKIGVDLGELRKITGLTDQKFGELQARLLQTQAANAQENALKRIATACNLTEKEVQQLGKQFGMSRTQIESVTGSAKKAERSFSALGVAMKAGLAYLSAGAIARGVKELVATADAYTNIENKLRLVTASGADLEKLQKQLYTSANNVRASFESHADLYVRVARSMGQFNLTQEQTLAYSEAIARSMIISGATTQEAASFAIQFSQAMQKGVANGDEFRAIMESNGRAVKVLTDYLGVSAGELRRLSTEGKITADVLYNAFSKSSDQLRKEFDSMNLTVGQSLAHLKNAYGSLVDGANDSTGATGRLASEIKAIARTIEDNKLEIVGLFADMATAANAAIGAVDHVYVRIKALSASAAGALDFSDAITMSTSEFKRWDKEFDSGVSNIKRRLKEAREEMVALSDSATPGVARRKMAALAEQIPNLEAQLKAAESMASKVSNSTTAAPPAPIPSMGTVAARYVADESAAKKAAKELEKQQREYQSILDRLLPLEAAQRDYNESLAALDKMDPTHQTDRYKTALGNLNEELADAKERAGSFAKAMADAQRASQESELSRQETGLRIAIAGGQMSENEALSP